MPKKIDADPGSKIMTAIAKAKARYPAKTDALCENASPITPVGYSKSTVKIEYKAISENEVFKSTPL
jgi:hypothetical protein